MKPIYDAFLSYAHLDDEGDGGIGWVTNFQTLLSASLSRKLGRPTKIWRDREFLDINRPFESQIALALSQSAVMISIVSTTFIVREWFSREYQEYLQVAPPLSSDRGRIFIIYKNELHDEQLPEYFRQFLGYQIPAERPEMLRAVWRLSHDMAREIQDAYSRDAS